MTDFTVRNLSVLACGWGFTSWHYRHGGPLAEACAPSFFIDGRNMIEVGDMIMVSASDGGVMLYVGASDKASGVVVKVMAGTVSP